MSQSSPPKPHGIAPRIRTNLVDPYTSQSRCCEAEQDAEDATLPGTLDVVQVPRIQIVVEREADRPESRRVIFDGAVCRLGSHPSNELVLNDRRVSRFHCALRLERGVWRLGDSGSLNGTYLNGIRLRDVDVPHDPCSLRIGDSTLVVSALQPVAHERVLVRTSLGTLAGGSLAMRRMYALIENVAGTDSTVVIQGESGTGKELIASEIVKRSKRADQPFVIADCGAFAPELIESELFGHARGAFTGADRDRVGAFEAADGGTVFLDEVGDLPVALQPKLLRVLESRQIRRLGEVRARDVDVRIIAATNRNLEREVNRGAFREDLFFRLSVVTIHVPPLRERLEDLPLIIDALLERMQATLHRPAFSSDALASVAAYDWPGNVREVRNWVERSIVLHCVEPVPVPKGSAAGRAISISTPFKAAKEQVIAEFEQRYLTELMRWSGGKVGLAARKAGIDRMYVYRLMQRHGLKRDGTFEE
ncbi:MAG: sigma 54-dependent Fis family transcriptional regulator [Polyangiaceae bacterium]|jgi:DNA-binding NtrC family response regulator|nr:sigma 54-dependent Fis family transcriptional regulator [Polyangiaceae bacterium]